jgi:hypothetical protein
MQPATTSMTASAPKGNHGDGQARQGAHTGLGDIFHHESVRTALQVKIIPGVGEVVGAGPEIMEVVFGAIIVGCGGCPVLVE